MSRDPIAMRIPDLAAFARSLRRNLATAPVAPGHLALLNILARSAGYANFQHLRATPDVALDPTPPNLDEKRLERALRLFDPSGRMTGWPARTSVQELCLWGLWSKLPPRKVMSEPQINSIIIGWHSFGDHALLRRSLLDHKLAERQIDGSAYQRIERAPTPEALALIRVLGARRN